MPFVHASPRKLTLSFVSMMNHLIVTFRGCLRNSQNLGNCGCEGDVRFVSFPFEFFIYEFCISMPDHMKQQMVQEFLPERSRSPGKRQNWILLFYQSGRGSKHIKDKLHILSQHSVAHCFTLLHNVRHLFSLSVTNIRYTGMCHPIGSSF